MSNFYCLFTLVAKRRQRLSLSVLACLALTSCTPQEECVLINGAMAEGNLQIQTVYEGNRGGSGYNQGIERQVGRIYFDTAQVLDGLTLSDQRLQTIQFQLVEGYQQASDYRYQAAELIASNPELSDLTEADIRRLQLDPQETIGAVTETLRQQCPLR